MWVRVHPKAKVSDTMCATNQSVLLDLSGSVSPVSRHTPARVGTDGRRAHMQWLGTKRQLALKTALGKKRLGTARDSRNMQKADGVGNAAIVGPPHSYLRPMPAVAPKAPRRSCFKLPPLLTTRHWA